MSSYVHICPGCGDHYRDEQTYLWHTETCDDYAAMPDLDVILPAAPTLSPLLEPSGNHCRGCGWSSGGHDPRCVAIPPGSTSPDFDEATA